MNRNKIIAAVGLILIGTLAFGSFAFAGFEDWNVDWRQFEGKHIDIGLVRHPMTDSILPLIPEFEKLTGIDVGFEVLSEVQFREILVPVIAGSTIVLAGYNR